MLWPAPTITWIKLNKNYVEENKMLDLVIKNGKVVDGSGLPAFVGDVAVKDGVIVKVGRVNEAARATVDATGQSGRAGIYRPAHPL